MKFTILKKVFGSGAAAPKPKFAFLALLRDIEMFPPTDSLGVVLLGDVIMKENCGMMQIYITPSSQEYGYETSGDSGSKGYKVKFNGTHPGTEKEALEFVTNYLEEEFVILIPDCNKGVRVLGSPEAPLVFTSTHKSAKDGQKFNFIFEQEVAVDFIYRLYDGKITLNDNIDIDMGDFLEALKNYIKIDGSNLSEMQKQNLRQILGLDSSEGNIGNKDLSLNENRNFNLKSFFLNFFSDSGTAKVGINKNNPETALEVIGGIRADAITVKNNGKIVPVAIVDEGMDNKTYNKEQILDIVDSDFKGVVLPTSPTPTVDGTYEPGVSSEDGKGTDPVNYGTAYPNIQNYKAKSGYRTRFVLKNGTWSKSEVAMPQATNEIEIFSITKSYGAGKQFVFVRADGSMGFYQVKAGQTIAVGETPETNPEKVTVIGSSNTANDESFTYFDTVWSGNNFMNLSDDITCFIDKTKTTGFLMVKQDAVGGRTLTVEHLTLDINLAPNEKTLIGYVLIGTTLHFSINKNIIETILSTQVGEIPPTFTNVMGGFSTVSSGVYTMSLGYIAGVSNETLEGDGYIEFDANVTGDVIFALDSNDTVENFGLPTFVYEFFVDVAGSTGLYHVGIKGQTPSQLINMGSKADIQKFRLSRTGTTVKLLKSTDGTIFTDAYTCPNPISGKLWIKLSSVEAVPATTVSLTLVNQ